MTIYEAYQFGKQNVENLCDLISIFKSVFGMDRVGVSVNANMKVPDEKFKIFCKKIDDLKNNVPIQYIVGNIEFLDLNLKVGDGVFIPRDETTLLVTEVIKNLDENFSGNIIDLCAGSGNIGISLKKKFVNSHVYEVEKSEKAFEYLEYNKKSNDVDVNCILGDIFEVVNTFDDGMFDVIVSNPPYIRTDDIPNLDENVKKEPKIALDGGKDGLYFYRNILSTWKRKLKKTGFFAFEIGDDQYDDAVGIAYEENFNVIRRFRDFNNLTRIVFVCFK